MENTTRKPLIIFLFIAFFIVLIRTAWIGDDSYITMRTVDNFINGYSLTWNPGERVQSYTHPLWMSMLIPIYAVSKNAYLSLLVISFIASLLTMFIFLNFKKWDETSMIIGWAVLILSNSFIDYSTSGLENPLSHLIALVFILLYISWDKPLHKKQVFFLALLASLITLNRIDLLLIFAPALLDILFFNGVKKTIPLIFAGFLIFIAWESFSIIYYGFPFPNTYYAKLNTGISPAILMKHGFLYFLNSIAWDPITLLVIASSFITSIISGARKEKMISLGILLYLLYIIWIGGDFMSGRFFSTPLLGSVVILLLLINKLDVIKKMFYFILICAFGFSAYTSSITAPDKRSDDLENLTGVSDEQAWYYSSTGLLQWGRSSRLPNHPWVYEGRELKDNGIEFYIGKGIGFLGYNAGPTVHVIDYFALSDPLLSRLSVNASTNILIGHFRRPIPAGYIETLETGNNQIEDKNIAQFYDILSLVTKGEIWSLERWQAIWMLNTGQYDYLLSQ